MSRLFIIEGADSTGKSTLAKKLAYYAVGMYIHASGRPAFHPIMEAYHLDIVETARQNLLNGCTVIIDRHWPSEFAYGSILRPQVSATYSFQRVHEALDPLRPEYIYCRSPRAFERHQTLHKESDHCYTEEQYKQIVAKYDLLFGDVPHRLFNLDTMGLETFMNSLWL